MNPTASALSIGSMADRQECFDHFVGEALILDILDEQPGGGGKIDSGRGQARLIRRENEPSLRTYKRHGEVNDPRCLCQDI
ncbi:hypothetical protein [Mesorhizobium cantuariense]|uniref:Uncharacterized protein n=1 Tax=Mesorhizobium cantuariense TaxID=1300275 RepID=A0ABV7MI46_9HYPH